MVYVSTESSRYKISSGGCNPAPDFLSTQEEADTKMLLHAKHAGPKYIAKVIVSKDTDVLILALSFHAEIPNIYIKCATETRTKYINKSTWLGNG